MLETGKTFAHFKVIRKLGEGGMGEVYLAEDTKLNRNVALKVLLGDVFDNPERQERFSREAKSAAQISHNNVMAIYDIGVAEEPRTGRKLNYIVMEYIEGESLTGYLNQRGSELASVVRLAEKIASGLAAAHKMKIVHRDIKADNIIINSDGEPKILDFGLAKPSQEMFGGDADDSTKTIDKPELTRAGKILGTVSYMSPEQSRGEKIDTRSDIFSFGVLLYRMATGEFPFAGPSAVSTLAKILETKHESPRAKNASIPPELERMIDKCLGKDPNDRYQDTRDLVVDLRNLRRLYDSGATDTISAEFTAPSVAGKSRGLPKLERRWFILMIVISVMIFLAVMEYLDGSPSVVSRQVQARPNSLAILGFENKTGDPELDWLETGLPEILLTDLAQTEAITIISQERIMDCFPDDKGGEHTFDECVEAAGSLGAVNLLSGTFYKLGDKIRIDARLQDVATGNVISGEKVIGEDPFTLVDSLTQKIAAALNLARDVQDRSVTTYTSSSPEAYRHYREGVKKMYQELYSDAIEEFNKALVIDSTFALPYMRIGMCYVFQGKQQEGANYFAQAREYESKLPPRDQNLLEVYTDIWVDQQYDNAFIKMASFIKRYNDDKEGHVIYGLLVSAFTGDTAKAFAHFDTALQIDPTYQLALSQFVNIYNNHEQFDEAIHYALLMRKYHPESPEPYMTLARIYGAQGGIDAAMAELTEVLTRFGEHRGALRRISELYIVKRDFIAAADALERYRIASGDDPHFLREYWDQRSVLRIWKGQFKAAISDCFEAYQEALKTEDSMDIYRALLALSTNYHRVGMGDSAFHYLTESNRWGSDFTMANYLVRVVAWDHEKADLLQPRLDSALEALRARLPNELWPIVESVETMFYALGRGDTAAIIENLRASAETTTNLASESGGRELGTYLTLTGHYEEGREKLLGSEQDIGDLASAYRYITTRYYLGIAEEGLGNSAKAKDYYEEVLSFWGKADVETNTITDVRKRLASLTG